LFLRLSCEGAPTIARDRIDHTLAIEFTDGHTRVTTQHVGLEGLDLLRARRLSQLTQVTRQR